MFVLLFNGNKVLSPLLAAGVVGADWPMLVCGGDDDVEFWVSVCIRLVYKFGFILVLK
jgi:hypothetical protein